MTRQRLLIALGVVALAAVVAVGLAQAPRGSSPSTNATPGPAQIAAALSGSPPALAGLHAQADQLLGGGGSAVQARLAALRGHPVVLNKWASWCGPCRTEFPLFQRVGVSLGRQVAFLGLDSGDVQADAKSFLSQHPVTYPSYTDTSGRVGISITRSTFFPVTVFYDAAGRQTFIHQGPYRSESQLTQDVRRYTQQT